MKPNVEICKKCQYHCDGNNWINNPLRCGIAEYKECFNVDHDFQIIGWKWETFKRNNKFEIPKHCPYLLEHLMYNEIES